MERALGAARADALVGCKPAASTSAVTCAARPRAFQGAWRACARRSASGFARVESATGLGEPKSNAGGACMPTLRRRFSPRRVYRRFLAVFFVLFFAPPFPPPFLAPPALLFLAAFFPAFAGFFAAAFEA